MAVLVTAIHVLPRISPQDVDGRAFGRPSHGVKGMDHQSRR
ncbi:MAG: hypothetical protein ACREDL_22750 [Bradyrhizobium sp.]